MTTPTLQPSYIAPVAITISPASVATSSTFVAGRQSDVQDNTTNLYDDVHITGVWTSGTGPTANTQVKIFAWAARDPTTGTVVYPDAMGASDAARSITSIGVGDGFLRLGAVLNIDTTTTARPYDYEFSIAELFGGIVPQRWGLWITHNTGVNANSTAGNHKTVMQGLYLAIPSI